MENKKIITIPDGWHEVNIKTYQEILNIDKDIHKDLSYLKEIISILTNEDLEDIPIQQLNLVVNKLGWINILPDETKVKSILDIDNKQYGLISKFEQIRLGEWIDLEEYMNDYQNNLHILMAILYRPIINGEVEKYDANTLIERSNIFKDNMMIGDVYASFVFFCLIGLHYINNLNHYLILQLMTTMN